MAAPYILAGSMREAHEFAQNHLGLGRGHYRLVMTASTLKSVRGADLHLVPGWEGRYDKFSLRGAIRWTRMNVIDHKVAEPLDGLNPPGIQTELDLGCDLAENPPVAQESEPEPAPRVRRRRCKDCGILVEPDQVAAHAKDHEHDLFGGE